MSRCAQDYIKMISSPNFGLVLDTCRAVFCNAMVCDGRNVRVDMALEVVRVHVLYLVLACDRRAWHWGSRCKDKYVYALPAYVLCCFVQVLAAGNLGGRIGWAAFSDKVGRKLTFNMFCLGSIPLYLAVPYTVQQVVGTGVSLPCCSSLVFAGCCRAVASALRRNQGGRRFSGQSEAKWQCL